MVVYHASYTIVEHPDVSFSRDSLDFGKGFYLTTIREQSVRKEALRILVYEKTNIRCHLFFKKICLYP